MLIRNILKTSVRFIIGHSPTDAEMQSIIDWLNDALTISYISDIELEIYKWRHACLTKCDECGDWFLETFEFDHNYHVMGKRFCSRDCCDSWEYWNVDEKPEISQHI